MFQDQTTGVPTTRPAALPEHQFETVRHILFGTLIAVRNTMKLLHKLNYAEPNDWSQPLPTGRPNEVMTILTKRVKVD